MMLASWIAIFAGAVVAGAALVGLLTLKRSAEPLMAFLSFAGVVACAWGISTHFALTARAELLFIALLFAVASFAGGYGLGSALLPMLARRVSPVPIPPTSSTPGTSGIAVILLTCLEPSRYEPSAVSSEFERLSEDGLHGMDIGIAPFLYAAQKARYRAVGDSSPSISQATALLERVESLLKDHKRFDHFRLVTCTGNSTLDHTIAGLTQCGVHRFVVATVSIGESYEIDNAKSLVDLLRPSAHGISIVYTAPLWGSERLALAVTNRILSASNDLETTGVALVMNGQPEHHRRIHNAFDVQESAFCNRIRLQLVERGMINGNIRLCSLEWRDPDVTETVRHLAALGCQRVLVVPACLPFDTVATRFDLQMAIRHARVDDVAEVVTLQTWGLESTAAEVIADAVQEAANDPLLITP